MRHVLETVTELPLPIEEVFDLFARAENLERITPPELKFRIITPRPIIIDKGSLIDYRLKLHGIPFRWRTLISDWDPPHRFVDEQLKGPYREWIHTHRFEPTDNGTRMTDEVRYRLPFSPLGEIAHFLVRPQLERIFEYRRGAFQKLLLEGKDLVEDSSPTDSADFEYSIQ
jgi:ligand-binding SRPBCC domain-containing protein